LEIPIKDASPEVFIELLRFIYTGRCNFDEDNLVPLLSLADLWTLDKLTAQCEVEIMQSVTKSNVMELIEVAIRYNSPKLHRALVGFALEHLDLLTDVPNGQWDSLSSR